MDGVFVQAERYLQACADLYRAFEIVDTASGQLQTRDESSARVEAALAVLSGLDAPAVASLRR